MRGLKSINTTLRHCKIPSSHSLAEKEEGTKKPGDFIDVFGRRRSVRRRQKSSSRKNNMFTVWWTLGTGLKRDIPESHGFGGG